MYLATARWRPSPRHATNATRLAISRVTAPRTSLVEEDQVATAVEAEVDRRTPSVTSAAKSAILRGHALRPHLVAEEAEEDTAVAEGTLVAKPATRVVELAISPVIAFKALNAITAAERAIFPRTAPNLSDGLAIPVDLKDISRVTAPV